MLFMLKQTKKDSHYKLVWVLINQLLVRVKRYTLKTEQKDGEGKEEKRIKEGQALDLLVLPS